MPARVRIALTAIIFGALLYCGAPQAAADPQGLLHRQAPQFRRNDLNGRRIDLATYRGKVVLLTFWATWCAPCQIEMPQFIQWQKQYGPEGLQILGISMDDDAAPVRRITRRKGVNYPIVMGDAKLAKQYGGVMGLPVSMLIDRRGEIVAIYQGESSLQVMRQRLVSQLHVH